MLCPEDQSAELAFRRLLRPSPPRSDIGHNTGDKEHRQASAGYGTGRALRTRPTFSGIRFRRATFSCRHHRATAEDGEDEYGEDFRSRHGEHLSTPLSCQESSVAEALSSQPNS